MALTPTEDEELRRINVFMQFGELPPAMHARFRELRDRDDRLEIREPTIDVVWIPKQRTVEDAIEDLLDQLDEEADEHEEATEKAHDMSAFEAALSAPQPYIVEQSFGGFVPSRRYGSR